MNNTPENDLMLLLTVALILAVFIITVTELSLRYIHYRDRKKQEKTRYPAKIDIYTANYCQLKIWKLTLPQAQNHDERHKAYLIETLHDNFSRQIKLMN